MATWRDAPYHYQGYLFLLKPVPVFKARVNMSSVTYPWQRLTYDTVTLGAYADIKPDMTILLGSTEGGDDLGRNRTRWTYEGMVADADTIYVGQFSRGVRDGEFDVVDDAYITVLDDYRIWARIPRVTDAGEVYKDYKLNYDDCEPQPPVANAGVGYAGFIDPNTNKITVDFDGTSSFCVASGASITGYAWDFVDGTPATGNTAQVSGVTFPTGFRWVKLTVTDSNGQSHTARVPVLAADPDATANGVIRNFEISEQSLTSEGQRLSVRVYEDIDLTDYPDGTLVMYWEREVHGGVVGSLSGPTGRQHMKFIGWLDTDNAEIVVNEAGVAPRTTLTCVDVGGRLRQLPGFPFVLERDGTPTKWSQLKALNIDRYVWFILRWHSTALELADFVWSGTGETYAIPVLGSDGVSLWEQADGRAQAIAHRLTCDRFGRLSMRADPQLQDSGDRTSTVLADLGEGDWANTLVYSHQRTPRVHWLWGSAIQAATIDADAIDEVTPLFCVAPGKAPGQGAQETSQGEQVVASQTELNAREGHRYAIRHNAAESYLEVHLAHPGDSGIDPALLQWVRLTVSANTAAQRGLTFTNERFLPAEVSIDHDHRAGTKRVRLSLERERVGTPAATYIPPTGEFEQFEDFYPGDYGTIRPEVGEFWLKAGAESIAAFGMDSYVYRALNFKTGSPPAWDRKFLNLLGTPVAFVVDPFSPGYIGGGSAINGWVATTRGVYRITDIFGASPGWTLQHDYGYTIDNLDSRNSIGIDASFGTPNHVVVMYAGYDQAWGKGKVAYTIDGVNWALGTIYGETSAQMTIGAYAVYVSPRTPGLVYVTQLDTDGYTAHNYVSTNYGQTFARMYSHGPRHPYMQYLNLRGSVCIHVPYDDNPDEDDLYYVRHNAGNNNDSQYVRRIKNGVDVNITPSYLSKDAWGPKRTRWGLMTCPVDRMRLVMCATTGLENTYLFVSTDEGDTWSVRGTYGQQVAIAGDNPDVLYIWGEGGGYRRAVIYYSEDFGVTMVDKKGNLVSEFDAAELIGICGGPTT